MRVDTGFQLKSFDGGAAISVLVKEFFTKKVLSSSILYGVVPRKQRCSEWQKIFSTLVCKIVSEGFSSGAEIWERLGDLPEIFPLSKTCQWEDNHKKIHFFDGFGTVDRNKSSSSAVPFVLTNHYTESSKQGMHLNYEASHLTTNTFSPRRSCGNHVVRSMTNHRSEAELHNQSTAIFVYENGGLSV